MIPVLLRPVANWQGTGFGNLQVLPSNGKPVTNWPSQDDAFVDIAEGIRAVLQDMEAMPVHTPSLTLPPVWNIPYPRNPYFTGRDELLDRLSMVLKAGQAAALSQAQAISGLGGIGKTQVAVEYAYRHRNEYEAVLWVHAATRESLVSGYIALARLLNLAVKDAQDQDIVIKAVKNWLQTHASWLLILDNADDLSLVYEFLPSSYGGHPLLTTRAQATGTRAQCIEVETMLPEAGILFLLRRAKLIGAHAPLDDANPADIAVAREITNELGGLPLALDQAAAFIEECQCSLAEYSYLYRIRRAELLKERVGLVEDHRESVATTWSISFKKVEEKNEASADLLRFCAFLAPDVIPEEMITKGAPYFESPLQEAAADALLLNRASAALLAYSLVRRNTEEKTLSVHRLVQAVLRDEMDESTQKQWAERVVLAVNEVFPDVREPQCEQYLSHALSCAELVEQELVNSLEASELLHKVRDYLMDCARASFMSQLTLAIGGNYEIAREFERQGKAEAEALYRRLLAIEEKVYGSDSPAIRTGLNNLALLYYQQGKYAEAEPLFKRVQAMKEQQLGPMNPYTATGLNNLAEVYEAQGKYAEAEPLYKRALAIYDHWRYPEFNISIVTSLKGLRMVYELQGKYAEAEPLYNCAHVAEKTLPQGRGITGVM